MGSPMRPIAKLTVVAALLISPLGVASAQAPGTGTTGGGSNTAPTSGASDSGTVDRPGREQSRSQQRTTGTGNDFAAGHDRPVAVGREGPVDHPTAGEPGAGRCGRRPHRRPVARRGRPEGPQGRPDRPGERAGSVQAYQEHLQGMLVLSQVFHCIFNCLVGIHARNGTLPDGASLLGAA
jgi:hypothetical protein